MNVASTHADDVAGDADRPRRHAVYRLAFGVGGTLIAADAFGATLPFLAAILAMMLLANADRPPRLMQGFIVFLVIVVATIVVNAVSSILVDHPIPFAMIFTLMIFLSFYVHWRGAPPIVTLLTQLAIISVPLYSIVSPEAATMFSYLLWEASFIAVIVVWIAFAAFPIQAIRPEGPQRVRLEPEAARKRAAIDTIVLLPMLIWHWTQVPHNTSFYILFVAIMLLREQSETGRGQLANLHVRAALLGGLAAVLASMLVVSNDTFPLFACVVMVVCLWFSAETVKGGRHGAVMLVAFSTFLIVFGLGLSDYVSATDYLTTRLARLFFAILYVVAAMSLVDMFRRQREPEPA